MLTVSASQARANFSRLGEEIFRTKRPVTVFKNSKPWLVITPAQAEQQIVDVSTRQELSPEEQLLLAATNKFVDEYSDVFEVLAQ
ncbi:MAG: type II toxin-antitoxin system Phd/YefM family antitoxin [Propionibacteriaceae bacterium]|nr:type II toxin-antitoxin system Phd/YefM family antitoxin [Propionibacteriaceae bacterium]